MKYLKLFEDFKQGSPEELVELLKYLPVDETAKYISEEIILDLQNYYENGIKPGLPKYEKTYTYHPEDKCLKPYDVMIHYLPSNNTTYVGYASENDIQLKYINKDSSNFKQYGGPNINSVKRQLYNIVKHECSHFYLGQKDVEVCLYHTHPDGMKKYYYDRQEMVLHSREIFDDFVEYNPNWKTLPIEKIETKLKNVIKYLQQTTRVNSPFNPSLQKKYLNFIMNSYIKPNLES